MVRNTERLSLSVFLNPLNIFSINLIEVNKDVLGIFLDADSALRGLNHWKTYWLICVKVEKSYGHFALQWRHNEHNGVSNNRRLDCLLNRLFRRRSKKVIMHRMYLLPCLPAILRTDYRQTSNISRIKSQNLNVPRLVLQLSLIIPL